MSACQLGVSHADASKHAAQGRVMTSDNMIKCGKKHGTKLFMMVTSSVWRLHLWLLCVGWLVDMAARYLGVVGCQQQSTVCPRHSTVQTAPTLYKQTSLLLPSKMASDTQLYTCNTCSSTFDSSELQRSHMRASWQCDMLPHMIHPY